MTDLEAQKLYNRTYYAQHKQKRIETSKRWREENPERARAYRRAYMKRYRSNMPEEQKERYRATRRKHYRMKKWLES